MSAAEDLQRAYQLIREDNTQQAEQLLVPILQENPENVDAWWLMAYVVEEPADVREALNRVLTLDPNYSQAPKAREMLEQLNAEYPPEPEIVNDEFEQVFGESAADSSVFTEDVSDSPFDETLFEDFDPDTYTPEQDSLDDAFGGAFEAPEDELMDVGELFGETPAPSQEQSRGKPQVVTFNSDEPLDEETKAMLEEQVARRDGRGRRWLAMLVFLVIVAGAVAVVVMFATPEEDEGPTDPGSLQMVSLESDTVNDAIIAANSEIRLTTLSGDSTAVIASSSLGETLFVNVCGTPGPGLPEKALQGMDIAVNQAQTVEGELAAVGVSVEICDGGEHDTLYRAAVPLADAIAYLDGPQDDQAIADFQSRWVAQ